MTGLEETFLVLRKPKYPIGSEAFVNVRQPCILNSNDNTRRAKILRRVDPVNVQVQLERMKHNIRPCRWFCLTLLVILGANLLPHFNTTATQLKKSKAFIRHLTSSDLWKSLPKFELHSGDHASTSRYGYRSTPIPNLGLKRWFDCMT